jgi:glycosyltransferase involved in cell wall biosynthesis
VPYVVRPLGVLNRWGIENRRPWLKKLSFALVERRILTGAAAVHYTSDDERLQAEELGVRQRAAVIPNGAEMPGNGLARGRFRARYPELAGRLIILFLSRLDPKKGLDLLLPAFARARRRYPKATLVVAGNGEEEFASHLKKEAQRLGIASDLLWAGFLTGEEKWAALGDADIFVLPSYSENFGVAAVEAMGCGVPVVVSDQVAIHREISQGGAGLVVPCAEEAIAEALARLISDGPLRAEMSANGSRLARTRFSPEAATRNLLALYREISKSGWPAVARAAL